MLQKNKIVRNLFIIIPDKNLFGRVLQRIEHFKIKIYYYQDKGGNGTKRLTLEFIKPIILYIYYYYY